MGAIESIAKLTQTQDQLITRGQARENGIGRHAIDRALQTGRWQQIHRGVYATFSGELQRRHIIRAGLLYAGEDAVVTGAAACSAYGLRYVPTTQIVILVPAAVRREPMRGVEFRRTRVLPVPRSVHSIPCAPPERAVLDACRGDTSLDAIRAILCEVVRRGLTTPDRLMDVARRVRRNGPLVRRALEDVDVGCRSNPECEVRDLIRTSVIIPEPQWNQPISVGNTEGHEVAGLLIPKAHWKQARLAMEIDSAERHHFDDGPEATERRRSRYAALGWRVTPVSPRRVRDDSIAVLRELEAAYVSGLTAETRRSLTINSAPMRARM